MDSIRTTTKEPVYNLAKDPIEKEVVSAPVKVSNAKVSKPKKPKLLIGILITLLLISIASTSAAVYYYIQSKRVVNKEAETVSPDSVKDVVAKVAKLIVLPEGETPTLATVADPAQLKNQPFFALAKKGDQVLVYSVAKKVILYDPVANRIIDIAPLNVNLPPSAAAPK